MTYKYKGREKEYLQEYHQKLKTEHPEKLKKWRDKWNHTDEARKSWNKYDATHREQRRAYNKRWRERNRKKINEKMLERLRTDEQFYFKARTRQCVRDSVGRLNLKKSRKTEEIVGLPFDGFKKYLLKTWKTNYGTEWKGEPYHIDHIKPLSGAKSLAEVEILCHYTNLQMLKPKDNLKKGSKMSWQDDAMIEQAQADALAYMGEAEWREMYGEEISDRTKN